MTKDRQNLGPTLEENADHRARMAGLLTKYVADEQMIARIARIHAASAPSRRQSKATYQAMEALIHNLNTMHSRAGAQMPFSLASTTAWTRRPKAAWS